MVNAVQQRIPATYMRGGTSKGLFFSLEDLPIEAQTAGPARDALLLRVIGSPDPYGKQTDGMGAGTSSTSKTVILSKSSSETHDVDYLFGQVAIDRAFVDWSGNCGNLSAAVGAFAITSGLVDAQRIPQNGVASVRIWQANIAKTIIAQVPIFNSQVQEIGDFELDGVAFPAAKIQVEFIDPAGNGVMFPSGNLIDDLEIPNFGSLKATLINAGIATIFVNAEDIGFDATECQDDINYNPETLAMFETIRSHGALKMGLVNELCEAQHCQHTPKIAFVNSAKSYLSSSGKRVEASSIDLCVRALSMGKLHHAMMGTAAVAIGAAAAVPGTLVNIAAGGGERDQINFGHPSGTLLVGAQATQEQGQWVAKKAVMGRSARVLMEGWVRVPADS